MPSHLDRLRRELETTLQGATAACLDHGPEGKWTAAQVLEHLFLTYTNTAKGLNRCLAKGAPLATRPTARHRVATLLTLTGGFVPKGRKSPERAVPQGLPTEEIQRTIFAEINAMATKLDECERKFGTGTKLMDHPFLGPLTADEWRKLHWVHGRHHARQIRGRMRKS